jgi:O-antigen/teichoic acid export membrane protein
LLGAVLPVFLESSKPELAGFAPSFHYYAAFTLLLILEAPLGVTCHYLLRPRIQLVGLVVRCVSILLLGLWLVPDGGAVGAARAQLGGAAIGFLALGLGTWAAVRERGKKLACAGS